MQAAVLEHVAVGLEEEPVTDNQNICPKVFHVSKDAKATEKMLCSTTVKLCLEKTMAISTLEQDKSRSLKAVQFPTHCCTQRVSKHSASLSEGT